MCNKSNAQYGEEVHTYLGEAETFEEKDKCSCKIAKQERVILLNNTCI